MNENPTKWSILVVDDDATNREILTDSILAIIAHADIQHAANGEQAIDSCKEKITHTHQNFDLIFMDYQMPLVNGQEATLAIRKFEKSVALPKGAFIVTWSAARRSPLEGTDTAIAKPLIEVELRHVLQDYQAITQ